LSFSAVRGVGETERQDGLCT